MKFIPQKYDDYFAMDVIYMVKASCSCDEFVASRLEEIYRHLCDKVDLKSHPDTVYDFYDDKDNLLENFILVPAK